MFSTSKNVNRKNGLVKYSALFSCILMSYGASGANTCQSNNPYVDANECSLFFGDNNTLTNHTDGGASASVVVGIQNNTDNAGHVTIMGDKNGILNPNITKEDILNADLPAYYKIFGGHNKLTDVINANVFGDNNVIKNVDDAIVLGNVNIVNSSNSNVLGNKNTVNSENSTIIGNNITNNRDNTVAIGNADSARQITGVAKGTELTDGVNVGQLIETVSDAFDDAITYTDNKITEFSVAVTESISNSKTEAINTSNAYTDSKITDNNLVINQNMTNFRNEAISTSNAYTDNKIKNIIYDMNSEYQAKFDKVDSKINKNRKEANAGIAGVSAMANIPYDTDVDFPFYIGAGIGAYENGSALAIGAQASINKYVNTRVSVSWSNDQTLNFGAGVGIKF